MPSGCRSEILGLLWGLLVSSETSYLATRLDTFQTLTQGLFCLLPALHHPYTVATVRDDSKMLYDVIDTLRSGQCGDLDVLSVQNEYNAVSSPGESADLLRAALVLDSLSKCLDQCTVDARLWLLQNSLEVWKAHNDRSLSVLMHLCPEQLDCASRRLAFYAASSSNSRPHAEEHWSRIAEFAVCAG